MKSRGGAWPASSHVGPSNHASPNSAARSIGSASRPQNSRPSSSNVGTPNTPRAIAASVLARSSALTSSDDGSRAGASSRVRASRRAASPASAPPRQTCRITASTTRRFGPAAIAQAQQRQRVERVHRRHVQGDAVLVREPGDVAVGPGALGFDLGRALLPPMLQQAGEQQRPVIDRVGAAGQRLRQVLEGQAGKRRDRIEPENNRLQWAVLVQGFIDHGARAAGGFGGVERGIGAAHEGRAVFALRRLQHRHADRQRDLRGRRRGAMRQGQRGHGVMQRSATVAAEGRLACGSSSANSSPP